MIRIILFSLLALSALSPAHSQDFLAVNFSDVRLTIEDADGPYHYPALWERYMQRDTTMGPMEYRFLYYGYVFQEGYAPYSTDDNAMERAEKFARKRRWKKALPPSLEAYQAQP